MKKILKGFNIANLFLTLIVTGVFALAGKYINDKLDKGEKATEQIISIKSDINKLDRKIDTVSLSTNYQFQMLRKDNKTIMKMLKKNEKYNNNNGLSFSDQLRDTDTNKETRKKI